MITAAATSIAIAGITAAIADLQSATLRAF